MRSQPSHPLPYTKQPLSSAMPSECRSITTAPNISFLNFTKNWSISRQYPQKSPNKIHGRKVADSDQRGVVREKWQNPCMRQHEGRPQESSTAAQTTRGCQGESAIDHASPILLWRNGLRAALCTHEREKSSYQGASRLVRKILAGRFYYDIDIVNCYPVLLWNLLSNMEVNVEQKFPALHTAVFKRKEMIDAIMAVFQCEHDKAKRQPSVLINGGSIHGSVGWCAVNGLNSQHAECTIVDKLHEECQEAIALFTEQFPDHKAKSKEVFPKKSLRQHNIAPNHFELERLENE